MEQKKLGLPSVVATGVGLIVATSCLLSIGQGRLRLACRLSLRWQLPVHLIF